MPFSTAQLRSLALLPKITGSISILFSSLIVSNVIRNQQNHRRRTYHRIMCGISLADISASFWLALSTWPIPRSSNALWAVGTDTTCTLQGFFTQLGICSSFYNASLSIYYVLVIVWNWNDSQLRKVEWMLHLVPILFAVTTATAGVLLDIYGNATLWCFISAEHDPYRWAFFYGPLWVNIAIVTLSCGYIWAYVRKIERKANRWRLATSPPPPHPYPASNTTPNHLEEPSFSQPSNEASLPDDACISVVPSKPSRRSRLPSAGSASMHSSSHRRQSSSLHRTVSVANQCFLYAGAFYINWIALSVTRMLQTINGNVYYPLLLISVVTVPMQGLPNFLVYLWPRFRRNQSRENGADSRKRLIQVPPTRPSPDMVREELSSSEPVVNPSDNVKILCDDAPV